MAIMLLCRVEVVGLCFSDLKLLKQFQVMFARASYIGYDTSILNELSNYVPGDKPTVPGHETVETKKVNKVTDVKPGDRFLVQADYRWLKTENSNGAFGYNFEGALSSTFFWMTGCKGPKGESH